MSVRERDPLTGHETTGHEWNGITELNTRVPRAVWFFIIVTHLYALIAWILLPTWPLLTTYTRGLLGIDQRDLVEEALVEGQAVRAGWTERIAAEPPEAILADPALMAVVRQTAPALFGDNCAPCHGADAQGGPGFPNLVDGDWIWGGDYDTLMETVRVGINSDHPETRVSQMMAFGRDGMLSRDDVPRRSRPTSGRCPGGARRRRRRARSSSPTTARAATARTAEAWPSSAPRT